MTAYVQVCPPLAEDVWSVAVTEYWEMAPVMLVTGGFHDTRADPPPFVAAVTLFGVPGTGTAVVPT